MKVDCCYLLSTLLFLNIIMIAFFIEMIWYDDNIRTAFCIKAYCFLLNSFNFVR